MSGAPGRFPRRRSSESLQAYCCGGINTVSPSSRGRTTSLIAGSSCPLIILGNKGSIPFGLIMTLRISRTPSFRQYQQRVGNATYLINTTIVGLELIALGGTKPDSLNIRWKQSGKPRQTADQAKNFVLVAIMNLAVDAFDYYLRGLGKTKWLDFSSEGRGKLQKALTRPNNQAYSIKERAECALEETGADGDHLPPMLELAACWRNALVHASAAQDRLSTEAASSLLTNAAYFADHYAAIKTDLVLEHYRKLRDPTLKEATTLVAGCQNLARAIDEAAIKKSAGTTDLIERAARSILGEILLLNTNANLSLTTIWGKDPQTRLRKISRLLERHGISHAADGVSAELDEGWLTALSSLSRTEAERYLR
jgi:hypothetical protein